MKTHRIRLCLLITVFVLLSSSCQNHETDDQMLGSILGIQKENVKAVQFVYGDAIVAIHNAHWISNDQLLNLLECHITVSDTKQPIQFSKLHLLFETEEKTALVDLAYFESGELFIRFDNQIYEIVMESENEGIWPSEQLLEMQLREDARKQEIPVPLSWKLDGYLGGKTVNWTIVSALAPDVANEQEMFEKATAVLIGTCEKSQYKAGSEVTEQTIQIETMYKGTKEETIKVEQLGGNDHGIWITPRKPLMEPGKQYLMYLIELGGKYFVMESDVGIYEIHNERVWPMYNTTEGFNTGAALQAVKTKLAKASALIL